MLYCIYLSGPGEAPARGRCREAGRRWAPAMGVFEKEQEELLSYDGADTRTRTPGACRDLCSYGFPRGG